MTATRYVTRYPVTLLPSTRGEFCLEAFNPGFSKAPALEVVRFLVPNNTDPDRRILSATVGDRPLLPMDLPITVEHFFTQREINLFHYSWMARTRLPRWHPGEWVRVALDGPCMAVALLLAEPEGWQLPTFDRKLGDPKTCARCGRAERAHKWMCEHGHELDRDIDGLPVVVCHGTGATLFCPTQGMN